MVSMSIRRKIPASEEFSPESEQWDDPMVTAARTIDMREQGTAPILYSLTHLLRMWQHSQQFSQHGNIRGHAVLVGRTGAFITALPTRVFDELVSLLARPQMERLRGTLSTPDLRHYAAQIIREAGKKETRPVTEIPDRLMDPTLIRSRTAEARRELEKELEIPPTPESASAERVRTYLSNNFRAFGCERDHVISVLSALLGVDLTEVKPGHRYAVGTVIVRMDQLVLITSRDAQGMRYLYPDLTNDYQYDTYQVDERYATDEEVEKFLVDLGLAPPQIKEEDRGEPITENVQGSRIFEKAQMSRVDASEASEEDEAPL